MDGLMDTFIIAFVQTSNQARDFEIDIFQDIGVTDNYRGVSAHRNGYRARIKGKYIGVFDTAKKAARAYNDARALNGLHRFNFRGHNEPSAEVNIVCVYSFDRYTDASMPIRTCLCTVSN